MRRHDPPPRRPLSWIAYALLAALAGSPALAADLRFASLRPAAGGEWQAEVVGKGAAKNVGKLVFAADGQVLAAELEGMEGGRVRALLTGVPAAAARISVGVAGKKGTELLASVAVKPPAAAWSGWTIYHIMLGYFRNGHPGNDGEVDGWRHPNYAGGDLQGVLEGADHIASLGVDAVWLSPIFQSRTSHGYDVASYYRIGGAVAVSGDAEASLELFRRLVRELGERGVRVILDLPLNHVGRSYDFESGDPGKLGPRSTAARQEAEKLWDSWGAGFRYWNFSHPPTRRFLKDAALYWLLEEGVAGLRLDYVRGVPHDFWAEFFAEVKAKKPDAFLVGECWIDGGGAEANMRDIATYYRPVEGAGPQLDSLLDFPLQIVMTDVFARGGSAVELERWLQATAAAYGPAGRPTYFLDNHDMTRFLSWNGDRDRLLAALGFMASLSSPVIVYYGTEAGLANASPRPGFVDSGRIPMPWDDLDRGLVERVGEIFRARKQHPALQVGGRLPLLADKEVLVMAKVAAGERALVGVNLASEARTVELEGSDLLRGPFEAVIGTSVPAAGEDGRISWRLPPVSTSIAVARPGER